MNLQIRRNIHCERHCCHGFSTPKTICSFRHKRRITEYLLSHVVSCELPEVQLSLVVLLERVSDQATAEALLPTIEALTDKEQAPNLEKLFGSQFEEFASITVSALDSSVSGRLNDTSGTLWSVFLDTLRFYFQPGKYPSSDRGISSQIRPRVTYSTEGGAFQKPTKWSVLSPIPRSPVRDMRVDYHHRCFVNRCCEIAFSLNDRDVLTHSRNHTVFRFWQSS